MGNLAKYIPLFILLLGAFQFWGDFQDHTDNLEALKSNIPSLEVQIKRLQKEIVSSEEFAKKVESSREIVEKVAQEVEASQRRLPESISDTENMSLIQSIATNLNIRDINLSPGDESNQGFYFVKSYTFTASGTFLQFLIFFEKIAENQRLLNIQEVALLRGGSSQRGRFQLINTRVTVQAYRFNPDHREDRGLDQVGNDDKK